MKKYDSYKDSGIEWIGEIPFHWNIRKLKFVCKIFNGDSLKDEEKELYSQEIENAIPYVSTKDIDVWTSKINYENSLSIPVDHSRYKIAPKNSFLMCIEGGSAGRKYSHLEKDVFFVNKLACFETKSENNKFLYYYSQSPLFQSQFQNSLSGLIGGVAISQIRNFSVILPIPDEQTAIANYLDHKTCQIDGLIAKKERLIQLLEEERTAIINQAVTKGLDPTVPMKDSGIEWLGEIPAHWEVKRIGHVAKVVRGASPRPAGDPLLFNGDFLPWITVKEVTNAEGKFIVSTETYLTEKGSKNTRIIEPETLLLSNSGATLGVPRITKIKGGINDGSVAFFNLQIERDYLYYFFITHTKIYRDEVSGYGQPNLNTDIIKSTKIALPNKKEQLEIVFFIENYLEEFEVLKYKTQQEIELLKEYKTALISEVVTGKVDVRDYSKN
jgi:type I restriction enzyme S subunit